mgnify:CR=1 FL=1
MIRDVTMIARMNQNDPAKALEKVCAEFETLFVHQLLKTMAESVPDGFLEDGLAGDIYKDMFYQEVARNIGSTGALGVRDTLRQIGRASWRERVSVWVVAVSLKKQTKSNR